MGRTFKPRKLFLSFSLTVWWFGQFMYRLVAAYHLIPHLGHCISW